MPRSRRRREPPGAARRWNGRRASCPGQRDNGAMAGWRALTWPARYAALAAGALPVLAFPAPNLEFLAWFALVPGLLLMRASPSAREAGVRRWWFGAGFIFAAHYWLLPNIGPALLLVAIVLGALWSRSRLAPGRCCGRQSPPPRPGRPGGRAELLAGHRVDPVLAGLRRTVGAAGRQPVAASGGARAGRGGRRLAGQLRPGRGQHRRGDPDHGRPLPVRALGAAAAAVAIAAGPAAFALTPPPPQPGGS